MGSGWESEGGAAIESLAGRTALVVGASRNIGRAVALELARRGADVAVAAARDRERLEQVAAEIRAAGARSWAGLADISDREAALALVESASAAVGQPDILVNTVGIRPPQPFLTISELDWLKVLSTNLFGSFHLAQAVLPAMIELGRGRLIWFSGMGSFAGAARLAHSLSAKMGLLGLTRSLALEFAGSGVTVNVVVPGVIDTEREYAWSVEPARAGPGVVSMPPPPVGRLGSVAEVAALCAFLASDAGGFITGQAIHVNGGAYLG